MNVRSVAKILFLLILLLPFGFLAAEDVCNQNLHENLRENFRPEPEKLLELYEKSIHATQGKKDPFLTAGADSNKMGMVHQLFAKTQKGYQQLIDIQKRANLTYNEYVDLRKNVLPLIEAVLLNPKSTPTQLYAAKESVRLFSQAEGKTVFPVEEKKPNEEKKKPEDDEADNDKKKEDQPPQPPKPPQWQKMEDQYNPKNKRIESGEGGGDNPVMVEMDVPTINSLLPFTFFDQVTPQVVSKNTIMRPVGKNIKVKADGKMKVFVYAAQEIQLPIPYGYEPILEKNGSFEIVKSGEGEFVAHIFGPLEHFEVGLHSIEHNPKHFLDASSLEQYKKPTGINKTDWPPEFKSKIAEISKKGVGDDLAVAGEVTDFIKNTCYYHSKGTSNGKKISNKGMDKRDAELAALETRFPTPVAMAHLKSINCDGAAWMAASILKDFFSIPTRVVGGRTSTSGQVNGRNGEISKSNAPLHAWIEVYSGGKWVPFDATPQFDPDGKSKSEEQNERDKQQKEQNDTSDDSSEKDSQDQKSKDQKSQDQKDKDKKDKKDKEQKDKDSKDGKESKEAKEAREAKEAKEAQRAKEAKEAKDKKDGKGSSGDEKSQELTKITINDKASQAGKENPLIQVVMQTIEGDAVERSVLDGRVEFKTAIKNIEMMIGKHESSDFMRANAAKTLNAIDAMYVKRAYTKENKLASRIGNVRLLTTEGKFREAWLQLKQIHEEMAEVAKRRAFKESEQKFFNLIQKALDAFQVIKHKDSGHYDLAENLIKNLPGTVSKKFIYDKYGNVLELGSQSLHAFTADLLHKNLGAIVRASMLKGFVDLVLNSERIPRFTYEKTWDRAPQPKDNRDLVVAKSPLEVSRMILSPEPGQGLFDKTFRGEQFAIGTREVVKVPNPETPLEKKVSIVFWDGSGSMGSPEKFKNQEALLLAFVDKALSEVDLAGKPLHEVYLVEFGSDVEEAKLISTQKDALDFINLVNYYNISTYGSGTDITKALVYGYHTIAESYKKSAQVNQYRKLKKANLVLITDGEDNVSEDEVLAARKLVPEEVRIFLNFISLGKANQNLVNLASNSHLSSQKPMYRVLDPETMSKILNDSENLKLESTSFATDYKSNQTPPDLTQKLNVLSDYSNTSFLSQADKEVLNFLTSQVRTAHVVNDKNPATYMFYNSLAMVTDALKSGCTDFDSNLKKKILLNVLKYYAKLSNKSLNQINIVEKEKLEELIRWGM